MTAPLVQHVVLRMMKVLVLAATVPVVLVLAQCVRDTDHEAEQGRKWCEGVIAIFEADRAEFLRKHAKRIHHGMLVVRPTEELGPSAGDFVVRQSGEFVCRYWHDGILFPEGRQYTSERRRWMPIE